MNIDSNIRPASNRKERANLRKIQNEIPHIAAGFHWPPDAEWIREATAGIQWTEAIQNIHRLRYVVGKRLDPETFVTYNDNGSIVVKAHYDNPSHPSPVDVLRLTKPMLLDQVKAGVIDAVVISEFDTRLYGLGSKVLCIFSVSGNRVSPTRDYGAANASRLIRDLIGLDVSQEDIIAIGRRESDVTFRHESGQWARRAAEDSLTS